MQRLSLREAKTSAPYLKQDSENIMHFSLMEALPSGDTLALNRSLGRFPISHVTRVDQS